ncbi:dTDP-4-dehydrorhamnose 3,5-epimerase family protein [Flagellimonas sp. GZD32]|uniref:dTDP-4-dehydrorhamnose 3,5-epimerase family protein n=1 Tax=Flagellimonas cixiensis TaxID=3228750 RepID=UPI0035C90039
MKLLETDISGCFEIEVDQFTDIRGSFFKTFHYNIFKENGLETNWKEEYFSISHLNVIRGMHFQNPPDDHAKVVTCLSGSVKDVVVDLRKDSKTFKQYIAVTLNAASSNRMLYIPRGCAHGFLSLENNTLLHYKVSSVYSKTNDTGILWDSIGYEWNCKTPILSERDQKHFTLSEFESPF